MASFKKKVGWECGGNTNWLTGLSKLWGLTVKLNMFKIHMKSRLKSRWLTWVSVCQFSGFLTPESGLKLRRFHCLFKFLTMFTSHSCQVDFSAVLKVINAHVMCYVQAPVSSTNNGNTDKTCSHHISWFCATSTENQGQLLKKKDFCTQK